MTLRDLNNYGIFKLMPNGFNIYNYETEEDFKNFRSIIDVEKTRAMLGSGKEADEIWDSIKGYLY